MFLHDVRPPALPFIHLEEERSPRPSVQWSSVSLSETMQQDATNGLHCFSRDQGRFSHDCRERPALKVCNTRYLNVSTSFSCREWLKAKKTTKKNARTRRVDPPAELVNILLPCAWKMNHDKVERYCQAIREWCICFLVWCRYEWWLRKIRRLCMACNQYVFWSCDLPI